MVPKPPPPVAFTLCVCALKSTMFRTPRRFSPRMTSTNNLPVHMVPNGAGIQPTKSLPH